MLDMERTKRRNKRIMIACAFVAMLILLDSIPGVRHAIAQGFNIANNAIFQGHLRTGASTPPTVTNATLAVGSTDLAGRVTSTGASNPVLTFGTAYSTVPFCTAMNSGELENFYITVTATGITFVGLTNGAIAGYVCFPGLGG